MYFTTTLLCVSLVFDFDEFRSFCGQQFWAFVLPMVLCVTMEVRYFACHIRLGLPGATRRDILVSSKVRGYLEIQQEFNETIDTRQ